MGKIKALGVGVLVSIMALGATPTSADEQVSIGESWNEPITGNERLELAVETTLPLWNEDGYKIYFDKGEEEYKVFEVYEISDDENLVSLVCYELEDSSTYRTLYEVDEFEVTNWEEILTDECVIALDENYEATLGENSGKCVVIVTTFDERSYGGVWTPTTRTYWESVEVPGSQTGTAVHGEYNCSFVGTESYPLGDVNCDSMVNSVDLLSMKKSLLGLTGVFNLQDLNLDDKVTVIDLLMLKRYLLGFSDMNDEVPYRMVASTGY